MSTSRLRSREDDSPVRLGQWISGRIQRSFDLDRFDDQVAISLFGVRRIWLVIVVQKRDREPPRPAAQVLAELEVLELPRRGGDVESLQLLAVDPHRHPDRIGPRLISARAHADHVMRVPRELMVHNNFALRGKDERSITLEVSLPRSGRASRYSTS